MARSPFIAIALALMIALLCPWQWHATVSILLILFGSFHGAFDLPILFRRFSPRRAVFFIAAYALSAVLGFFLYRAYPGFGALLLLALSAWHFGVHQASGKLRLCSGALMLVWVIALHRPLHYLIPEAQFSPPLRFEYWQIVGLTSLVAAVLTWQFMRNKLDHAVIGEWLFWLALVPLIPAPLWFGCFFLLQHSRSHFAALLRKGYLHSKDILLAIVALAIPVLSIWGVSDQISFNLAELLSLWIAPMLLGLTIAHSLLIDGMQPLADPELVRLGAN